MFCVDRRALPGLHTAAFSVVDRLAPRGLPARISVFSDELDASDVSLLKETIAKTGKEFEVRLIKLDGQRFARFPALNGSWATYYRLFAFEMMEAERFLYLDADTITDTDCSVLERLPLPGVPVAWVPEAPLSKAVDRRVANRLGNSETDFYFNAGVMLINGAEWRRGNISSRAMESLAKDRPDFWDQSALNVVLFKKSLVLEDRFNSVANMRKHWPSLKNGYGTIGKIVHFLDYPKPWSRFGRICHAHYSLWHSVCERTAFTDAQRKAAAEVFALSSRSVNGYKRALKDKLLFSGYKSGWLRRVKGVEPGEIS